jgi:thiamine transporter
MLFDYIFSFTALGLSGLTSTRKYGLYSGYLIGIVGRMTFAVISGVIFFGMYAPEGQNVWVYSFGYNGLYIITEAAITIVVLLIPAVRKGLNQVRVAANEADSKRIALNKIA